MIISQFAQVIIRELIPNLKSEPDNRWHSNGFIYLVLFDELDHATEEVFRATIS